MKEYLASIRTYWESLNQRERGLASIGSSVVIVYLFYVCIGSPISTAIQTQKQELQDKKETWQWVQQIQTQHSTQAQRPLMKVDTSGLLSLLSKEFAKPTLHEFKYTMQQSSNESIQIHFESVPYPVFMQWLYSFSRQYQIIIQNLQIEHLHRDAGLVKLTLNVNCKNGTNP